MFCIKCGTKAVDGAVFCHNCGTNLASLLQQLQPSTTTTSTAASIAAAATEPAAIQVQKAEKEIEEEEERKMVNFVMIPFVKLFEELENGMADGQLKKLAKEGLVVRGIAIEKAMTTVQAVEMVRRLFPALSGQQFGVLKCGNRLKDVGDNSLSIFELFCFVADGEMNVYLQPQEFDVFVSKNLTRDDLKPLPLQPQTSLAIAPSQKSQRPVAPDSDSDDEDDVPIIATLPPAALAKILTSSASVTEDASTFPTKKSGSGKEKVEEQRQQQKKIKESVVAPVEAPKNVKKKSIEIAGTVKKDPPAAKKTKKANQQAEQPKKGKRAKARQLQRRIFPVKDSDSDSSSSEAEVPLAVMVNKIKQQSPPPPPPPARNDVENTPEPPVRATVPETPMKKPTPPGQRREDPPSPTPEKPNSSASKFIAAARPPPEASPVPMKTASQSPVKVKFSAAAVDPRRQFASTSNDSNSVETVAASVKNAPVDSFAAVKDDSKGDSKGLKVKADKMDVDEKPKAADKKEEKEVEVEMKKTKKSELFKSAGVDEKKDAADEGSGWGKSSTKDRPPGGEDSASGDSDSWATFRSAYMPDKETWRYSKRRPPTKIPAVNPVDVKPLSKIPVAKSVGIKPHVQDSKETVSGSSSESSLLKDYRIPKKKKSSPVDVTSATTETKSAAAPSDAAATTPHNVLAPIVNEPEAAIPEKAEKSPPASSSKEATVSSTSVNMLWDFVMSSESQPTVIDEVVLTSVKRSREFESAATLGEAKRSRISSVGSDSGEISASATESDAAAFSLRKAGWQCGKDSENLKSDICELSSISASSSWDRSASSHSSSKPPAPVEYKSKDRSSSSSKSNGSKVYDIYSSSSRSQNGHGSKKASEVRGQKNEDRRPSNYRKDQQQRPQFTKPSGSHKIPTKDFYRRKSEQFYNRDRGGGKNGSGVDATGWPSSDKGSFSASKASGSSGNWFSASTLSPTAASAPPISRAGNNNSLLINTTSVAWQNPISGDTSGATTPFTGSWSATTPNTPTTAFSPMDVSTKSQTTNESSHWDPIRQRKSRPSDPRLALKSEQQQKAFEEQENQLQKSKEDDKREKESGGVNEENIGWGSANVVAATSTPSVNIGWGSQ